jgi:HMG (high mobility group) box
MTSLQLPAIIAQAWNRITPEERAPWVDQAVRDQTRLEARSVRPKAKHASSPFLNFCNAHRKNVEKSNPGLPGNKISSILFRMWKAAPSTVRDQYIGRSFLGKGKYASQWDTDCERNKVIRPEKSAVGDTTKTNRAPNA